MDSKQFKTLKDRVEKNKDQIQKPGYVNVGKGFVTETAGLSDFLGLGPSGLTMLYGKNMGNFKSGGSIDHFYFITDEEYEQLTKQFDTMKPNINLKKSSAPAAKPAVKKTKLHQATIDLCNKEMETIRKASLALEKEMDKLEAQKDNLESAERSLQDTIDYLNEVG